MNSKIYQEALKRASNPNKSIAIYHNDETGELLWSVSDVDGFWFESFKTKQEALDFCKDIGWKVNFVSKDISWKLEKF